MNILNIYLHILYKLLFVLQFVHLGHITNFLLYINHWFLNGSVASTESKFSRFVNASRNNICILKDPIILDVAKVTTRSDVFTFVTLSMNFIWCKSGKSISRHGTADKVVSQFTSFWKIFWATWYRFQHD